VPSVQNGGLPVKVAPKVFDFTTVPGRQGRHKIIPQKNAEKINKVIKYFVEINKNEVNKNCGQKTKENV
jgi:hypothetical protein